MTKANDYKEDMDRIFDSGLSEWVTRSMSVYMILLDRIYTDVLPDVFAIIKNEHKVPQQLLNKENARAVLGKLVEYILCKDR